MTAAPRILMPTARGFARRAFQCGLYEAQDVLAAVDDVDLVRLQPHPKGGFQWRKRWHRRMLYHDFSRRLVFANPGLQTVRLTREYDVFVAVCQNHWDLLNLNAILEWKTRCRLSICWFDELWRVDLPAAKYWLHALNQFDYVFLGCEGSVEAVSRALGRRCYWVGGAVDALRFTPYPDPPPRVIDVHRIGRVPAELDASLKRLATTRKLFYLHDTFHGSDLEPFDHGEHREMLASVAKRSRYFVVAPAKIDMPEETGGQVEIGYRYYEGCAAGAVLLGPRPNCPSFHQRFDWPDAVIDVHPSGSDVADILSDLDRNPQRLRTISRRNAVEALRRHDWVHRWKYILSVAGVSPSPRLIERERHLQQLADEAFEDGFQVPTAHSIGIATKTT